ncbi:MAG: hypothetical protein HYX69_18705 [Planctomycetia bacterium]|nr:hypothetical protein [Planctomycetia bacterium]
MSDTLSAEIDASLVWLFQDSLGLTTIADASRLEYSASLADGTGNDQADKLWHDLRSVAASGQDDLVLSNLPQTIFGSAVSIALAKVKALLIVNAATTVGEDLIVGAAASNPWGAPFGATGHQVRVPADACLLLVNKKSGWTVAAGASDKLRVANVGTGAISYKIAVVGVQA